MNTGGGLITAVKIQIQTIHTAMKTKQQNYSRIAEKAVVTHGKAIIAVATMYTMKEPA